MLLRLWNRYLRGRQARLIEENRRLTQELRQRCGGGPIPLTRREIERLRASREGIDPKRIEELGLVDLDKDVIEVEK